MKCIKLENIPKLAWLSIVSQNNELLVYHGRAVEINPDWIVEGVWDGKFSEGNFHKSEVFFGSGIRVDGDSIYFSTSSSNQDRLIFCHYKDNIILSNSLTLMLSYTDARLDDQHDYISEARSILNGFKSYNREFKIVHPSIECFYQVFYENIIIRNGEIFFQLRFKQKKIKSYKQYYDTMINILKRIKDNYDDESRRIKFKAYSTLSSGYDSTAVTSLVKKIGVDTVFCSRRSNSLLPDIFKDRAIDDGSLAAKVLNMKIVYIDSNEKFISEDEIYYLASYGYKGQGSIINQIKFHSMAKYIEEKCDIAIVFNGYHGDSVWDYDTPENIITDDIIRLSQCGMDLMEIRLKSGFINVAVPYILATNINDLVKITKSNEMIQWKLNNSYDRPIARRIAESEGIQRYSFGIRKKAIIDTYRLPKNKKLRKNFLDYLYKLYNLHPLYAYMILFINKIPIIIKKGFSHLGIKSVDYRKLYFFSNIDIPFFLWIWSNHMISDELSEVFKQTNLSQKNS